jgi:hypothetical protein
MEKDRVDEMIRVRIRYYGLEDLWNQAMAKETAARERNESSGCETTEGEAESSEDE